MSAARTDKIWDTLSQDYDDRVFTTLTFPEVTRRVLEAVRAGTMLDLGCGPLPHLLDQLATVPDSRIVACDFSLPMLTMAKSRVRSREIRFLLADARSLSLSPASLDTVIAINSIIPEERPQADLIFEEIVRVLKPGGVLVALLPAFETSLMADRHWEIEIQFDMATHREYDTTGWQCFYTEDDIERLMQRHSFSSFHLERIYFASQEEIQAIRHVYGEELLKETLLKYPLFEHFLVAEL